MKLDESHSSDNDFNYDILEVYLFDGYMGYTGSQVSLNMKLEYKSALFCFQKIPYFQQKNICCLCVLTRDIIRITQIKLRGERFLQYLC